AGFWPGSASVQEAAFYAYAAPEPAGFRDIAPQPSAAYYHAPMGIFILPYAAVRAAPSPDDAVMAFLQGTYDAAANLAGWDRKALERPARSEEHTSELQSLRHLVCRLLLEKKKHRRALADSPSSSAGVRPRSTPTSSGRAAASRCSRAPITTTAASSRRSGGSPGPAPDRPC